MKRILSLAILAPVVLMMACQQAQLVEYKKFEKETDVPRISIEEAKKEFDAGRAIIIDTRPDFAFQHERIAGSTNLPFGASPDVFSTLPTGKKIILYCSCVNEHTSAAMGFQMNQKGVPNVYALVGGTLAWKNAGYPMEGSAGTTTSTAAATPVPATPTAATPAANTSEENSTYRPRRSGT